MDADRLNRYLLPFALSLLACLIAAAGTEAWGWLRYDRQAILGGQVWRVLSGHLAHLNPQHLGINLAGLILIWALVGRQLNNRQWLWVIGGCMLFVSLGLLILNPTLRWYVGLSGVLHGLLLAGAIAGIWRGAPDRPLLILVLILVMVKLGWEQFSGPLPGSEETAGGRVIVDAHLYGALFGALMAVYWRLVPGNPAVTGSE